MPKDFFHDDDDDEKEKFDAELSGQHSSICSEIGKGIPHHPVNIMLCNGA